MLPDRYDWKSLVAVVVDRQRGVGVLNQVAFSHPAKESQPQLHWKRLEPRDTSKNAWKDGLPMLPRGIGFQAQVHVGTAIATLFKHRMVYLPTGFLLPVHAASLFPLGDAVFFCAIRPPRVSCGNGNGRSGEPHQGADS